MLGRPERYAQKRVGTGKRTYWRLTEGGRNGCLLTSYRKSRKQRAWRCFDSFRPRSHFEHIVVERSAARFYLLRYAQMLAILLSR